MPAEVFFTDLRAKSGNNLLDKVDRLFDRAGLASLIKPRGPGGGEAAFR